MDCNVCRRADGGLTELRYRNGDAYEMYLCETCVERFANDSTVRAVCRLLVG